MLQKPKVHYRIHGSQPLSPTRSYTNPVCTLTSVCEIRFTSILPPMHLEIGLSLTVPTKSCMNFSSLPCVLHIPPFSFSLEIITLTISVEKPESRSSSLCSFFLLFSSSSLREPRALFFLSMPYSHTLTRTQKQIKQPTFILLIPFNLLSPIKFVQYEQAYGRAGRGNLQT